VFGGVDIFREDGLEIRAGFGDGVGFYRVVGFNGFIVFLNVFRGFFIGDCLGRENDMLVCPL